MMNQMYSWMDVLMAAISSGTLFTGLSWWLNKKLRQAKSAKEIQDVYKTMYENLQSTILKFQDENQKLYRAVARLERAVTQATTCKHYDDCPIRDQLQEHKDADADARSSQRHTARKKKCATDADACPPQPDNDGTTVATATESSFGSIV